MAASIPHYPTTCFSSRTQSIKLIPNSISRKNCKFKLPKASSSSNPSPSEPEPEPDDIDPVKVAFAKARAYKKAIQPNIPIPKLPPNPVLESSEFGIGNGGSVSELDSNGGSPVFADLMKQYRDNNEDGTITDPFAEGDFPDVEIIVGDTSKFAKATASKQPTILEEDSGLYKPKVSSEPVPVDDDPVKLAFAKARAYKEDVQSNNPTFKIYPDQVRESSQSLINKEGLVSEDTNNGDTPAFVDLLKQMAEQGRDNVTDDMISGEDFPEVEIIVGDASKVGQASASEPNTKLEVNSRQYEPKFTSWSTPLTATTSENSDFPEVEIVVGDPSKFKRSKPRITLEEESGLYKPKVSSEPLPVDNDPVKLAFAKASAYKEVVQSRNPTPKISPDQVRESSESWVNKEESDAETPAFADLLKQMAKQSGDINTDDMVSEPLDFPEAEGDIIGGDARKFGQAVASEPNKTLEYSIRYQPKFTSWENAASATAFENEGDFPEVEIIVGDPSKFERSKPRVTLEEESGLYKPKVSSEPVPVDNDPVKLAFAKASAYKEVVQSNNPTPKISPNQVRESPGSWMDKEESVSEYTNADTPTFADLLKQMAKQSGTISEPLPEGDVPEVEIIAEDTSKFGQAVASEPNITLKEDSGRYQPKVTSWGNSPSHSTSETGPEWEIIVGDASKFERSKPRITLEEESGLYKPKVTADPIPVDNDPGNLAFAKANVYKEVVQSNNTDGTISEPFPEGDLPEVENVVGDASKFGQAIASEPNITLKEDSGRYQPKVTSWGSSPSSRSSENGPEWEIVVGDASKFERSKPRITLEEESGLYKPKVSADSVPVDHYPWKLAFTKTNAYKEVVQSNNPDPKISPDQVRKSSGKWMNKEDLVNGKYPSFEDLMEQMTKLTGDNNTDDTISEPFQEEDFPEVEKIVGDPSKFGQVAVSEANTTLKKDSGQYKPTVTSWKNPDSDRTSENEGDFPEVEIIVGDASKFGRSKPRTTLEEESGLYKPKVSSEPVPVDYDPVKLAFSKAKAYKEVVQPNNPTPKSFLDQVQQSSESWMNKEGSVSEYTNNGDTLSFADLLKQMAKQHRDNNTDDTISEPIPEEDSSEVEMIVGDPRKFGQPAASEPNTTLEEDSGRNKPNITSWSNPPSTSDI